MTQPAAAVALIRHIVFRVVPCIDRERAVGAQIVTILVRTLEDFVLKRCTDLYAAVYSPDARMALQYES